MALSVFAGTFNKIAGTGAQAVTGVGFTPKILLLWTSYKSTASTFSDDYSFAWGMTTGASESYSCSIASDGSVGVSNRSKRAAAKALTVVQWGETLLAECGLTSFDADGFTLDWTTNGGGTQIIHFLALGGTDITGQKVFTWNSKASIGNHPVTGAGFSPTALIFARPVSTSALPVSAATADLALSFIDDTGKVAALNIGGDDGVANPVHLTYRTLLTDKATILTTTALATREASTWSSMDADGFTLSYSTANVADLVGCLAIRGPRIRVGASDGAAAAVTGVGWTPTALLFMGVQSNTLTLRADMRVGLGATTGATAALNQAASAIDDRSSSTGGNTNAGGVSATDQCQVHLQSSPLGINFSRRLVSFDADGFTLDGATGVYYAYMAFSDAPAAGGYFDDFGEEG